MPKIDEVFGIKFYMICELGAKHHKPHIHVQYGEYEASYDLDDSCLFFWLPWLLAP